VGHVAHISIIVYKVPVEKPEGKKPLASPRCIMEDNIRMYFQKQDGLAQSRFMLFRIWTSASIS
jgi:hypothetical protein